MATGNRLGVTRFATPSDTEIVVTRLVEAPREQVFDAWTKPEHVTQLDARPGRLDDAGVRDRPPGRRHLALRLARPRRQRDGHARRVPGRLAPERLVSTEHWGDPWPETLNAFDFNEDDDGTLITCTVVYPTKAARDAALETGMKEGMNDSFTRLAAFLG